ncbi:hypothetical protein BaRGS_00028310 [Batillaria attramentaria]|uniref:Uncharacterized protein n=1 Tax=Batillaria attramentaria TaxID=370345 RepID=A0ABD0K0E8_9CAEN
MSLSPAPCQPGSTLEQVATTRYIHTHTVHRQHLEKRDKQLRFDGLVARVDLTAFGTILKLDQTPVFHGAHLKLDQLTLSTVHSCISAPSV